MNQFKLVLLCVVLMSTLVSCDKGVKSSDVAQDAIFVNYVISYDERSDITTVDAAFFEEIQTPPVHLVLDKKASVSFNGETLPYDKDCNSYRKEYMGRVFGQFEYKDVDDKTFQNGIADINLLSFQEEPETISKSQAYELTLEGDPLEEGDELEIVISTMDGTTSLKFFENDMGDKNTILLSTDILSKIPVDDAIFYMHRYRRTKEIDGTSMGGILMFEDKAKAKIFSITE